MMTATMEAFRRSLEGKDGAEITEIAVSLFSAKKELEIRLKEFQNASNAMALEYQQMKDELSGARKEIDALRKQNQHLTGIQTMLSILLGMEACKENIPVRFFRAVALVNLLAEHKKAGTLSLFKQKRLNPAKILILDEFGYVPYDRVGSELLFDYLSEIHEQKSIILNTNLEFSQWVNVLYDKRMTTALIGRLIQHVELILFPGENNRLRESSINQAFARTNSRQGVSV